MTAAAALIAFLGQRHVACALIGGVALGAHGIVRATFDVDVLVGDAVVLEPQFWDAFERLGDPEIRRGDADDPLLGVVRFASEPERLDIIVGRSPLAQRILSRSQAIEVGSSALPIADRGDLVLLKLLAAGPQDLLDVRLLLRAYPELRATVEERLDEAPSIVRSAWTKIVGSP